MLWWLDFCVGIWVDVCGGEWISFVVFFLLFSGKMSCPLALLGGLVWVQFCGLSGGHCVLVWCVRWRGCVGVGTNI